MIVLIKAAAAVASFAFGVLMGIYWQMVVRR